MSTSTERSQALRARRRQELVAEVVAELEGPAAPSWRAIVSSLNAAGLRALRLAIYSARLDAARPTRTRPSNLAGGPPAGT